MDVGPTSNPAGITGNYFRYQYGLYIWAFALAGLTLGYLLDFPWKRWFLFATIVFPTAFGILQSISNYQQGQGVEAFRIDSLHYLAMLAVGFILLLALPAADKLRTRLPPRFLELAEWGIGSLLVLWGIVLGFVFLMFR